MVNFKKGFLPGFKKKPLAMGIMIGLMAHSAHAVMSNPVGPFEGRKIASTTHDITGTTGVGSPLAVTLGAQTDADGDVLGTGKWIYQWQVSDGLSAWANITGASGVTDSAGAMAMTPDGSYAGKFLRLCMSAQGHDRSYPVATKFSTVQCDLVGTPGSGDAGGGIPDVNIDGGGNGSIDDGQSPNTGGGESVPVPTLVIVASNENVNENIAYSQTLSATVPGVPNVTWSIEAGGDGALFAINGATGELTLAGKDFENPTDDGLDNTYTVTVKAVDSVSGAQDTATVVITVVDVDEGMAGLVVATVDGAAADGTATNQATLTVADSLGNPVVNEDITVTLGAGTATTALTGKTNANGEFVVELTHNIAEAVTVTFNWDDAGTAVTASGTVTFSVGDAINPGAGGADGPVQITDGSGTVLSGSLIVDTVLHSKVFLHGETAPAIDRAVTPSGKNFIYQWMIEDVVGSGNYVAIVGATGATYTVTGADQGRNIKLDADVAP
ncbi:Ig-like domain-containing protein [Aeromonas enteropelogenes]|uniref:Ig-like domain-containing protein n=1 Tax=Aeromonas enteropelogenes TaxID=29489 RepID=UPI003134AECF